MSQTKERTWIGLKDAVIAALLSALWLFVATICSYPFLFNLTLALVAGPALGCAVAGVIYILMCAKAPRRGTLLIMGALVAVYVLLTTGYVVVSVVDVLAGIAMELIMLAKGGYRNRKLVTAAYVVFGVCWSTAPMIALLTTKESVMAQSLAMGLTEEYVNSVFSVYTPENVALAAVVTAVGALVGGLVGTRFLKKHFAPAGIVSD